MLSPLKTTRARCGICRAASRLSPSGYMAVSILPFGQRPVILIQSHRTDMCRPFRLLSCMHMPLWLNKHLIVILTNTALLYFTSPLLYYYTSPLLHISTIYCATLLMHYILYYYISPLLH